MSVIEGPRTRSHRMRAQHGGIFVLGIMIIMGIALMTILVLDLARLERIMQDAQRAADAVSLGSARALARPSFDVGVGLESNSFRPDDPATAHIPNDYSLERRLAWVNAKRAALVLLRQDNNSVFGTADAHDALDSSSSVIIDEYDNDYPDGSSSLPVMNARVLDFGDMIVRVERGYLFNPYDESNPGTATYQPQRFVSLEGLYDPARTATNESNLTTVNIPDVCRDVGTGAAGLTNAVRVVISVRPQRLWFAQLIQIFTGPLVSRESVSSGDPPLRIGQSIYLDSGGVLPACI